MKKLLIASLAVASLAGCSEPNDSLSFEFNEADKPYSEEIKDAASVLSQLCPAAKKAESVIANYETDKTEKAEGMLGYRSEKYGWTYDVEFKVKDNNSQHVHWIYVGGDEDGINGFLVAGKQESLDFCKIDATMSDNYFMPISVSKTNG